jgi:hypothetical protein
MHHKDRKRIGAWLKDLREKEYIEWIYSTDFEKKTKPAVYYLAINGIRFIMSLDKYPAAEIRKRYRELSRQQDFISRCLLIVDCAIHLEARHESSSNHSYAFDLRGDYINPESSYHFLVELSPDLIIEKQTQMAEEHAMVVYLVRIFDSTTPRYMIRKQLKEYVTYLYDGDWRQELDNSELAVHIVCQTKADLIYMKRRTRLLLDDIGQEDDTHIRFTTIEKVKQGGVTGIIWEEV